MSAHLFFEERLKTPIGVMLVLTDAQGRLRAVDWDDHESRMHKLLGRQYGKDAVALRPATAASEAGRSLEAYFCGYLEAIDRVPVATGGTAFQRQVWAALRGIPAGSHVNYGQLAQAIGRSEAVRAVGAANGANPIGIVVPCHRVIGANAALTGYGGGLHRKRWLLEHEGAAGFAPA
ncbi:methylated-DNA--[protein]-cysteine S-methyltransferase [Achromobacter sp. Marseille-Q0513]|uniref:methylated-DNA--[protein]-cysteine S-methyltransferase n=1 Tax=Achromobacter sp. Marseille-Q0513 TaxID=2829161 RepID=UPI001B9C1011|nr:methylated-DNA--[protein]-cysteine S-methyltransferase [Achromobacter sp. Marseille-Q0513]MBR8653582.1 methylated-DNA--[protein]-cysteine S-methyltransferase [Achromobacter sp. Marseille-Q0513]